MWRQAYTSMGVRMAWVKEQQMAPAKAYLAYSPRSPLLSSAVAMDDLKPGTGEKEIWGAATEGNAA